MRQPISALARARIRSGLTQTQLGDLMGVSGSSVSIVENLHTRPWPRFRASAAAVLQVPEEDLFPESSDPRPTRDWK